MPIGTSRALVTWNFKSSEWTRWRFCVQVQKIHVSQLPGQPWLLLWSFEIPNFGTKTWMRKNPGFRFMPGFQDNRITLHFVGFHIPKNDTHTRKAIDVTISKTNWWPTSPTHHFSRFTLWLIRIFKNRKKHGLFEIWTFECLRIKFSKKHKKPTVYKLNRSKSESKRFTGYFLSFAPSCFFFLLHLLSEFAPNQFSMVSSDECPSRNPYWSFPASRFGDSLPGFRINSPVQFMHLIYVTVNHMWNIIFVKLEGDEQILLMAEILHQLSLVVSPIMFTVYWVLYVTGGAGFLPSTVLKS